MFWGLWRFVATFYLRTIILKRPPSPGVQSVASGTLLSCFSSAQSQFGASRVSIFVNKQAWRRKKKYMYTNLRLIDVIGMRGLRNKQV